MKGFLTTALLAAFLVTTPAWPQTPPTAPRHDISELSKPLLMEGMETTSTCSTVSDYGVDRLIKFYDDNKGDSTTDGSVAARARDEAVKLYGSGIIESSLLELIVSTLQTVHHIPTNKLIEDMTVTMSDTKSSLTDKYDSITEYEDFSVAFAASSSQCDLVLNSFVTKARKEDAALENKVK